MSPHCILWYGMVLYFIRSYCLVSHCYVSLLQRAGELPRSASSHFAIKEPAVASMSPRNFLMRHLKYWKGFIWLHFKIWCGFILNEFCNLSIGLGLVWHISEYHRGFIIRFPGCLTCISLRSFAVRSATGNLPWNVNSSVFPKLLVPTLAQLIGSCQQKQ